MENFWNQMTIRTCNNYERQQNAGFTQAMMPAIEKLYDTEEKNKKLMNVIWNIF